MKVLACFTIQYCDESYDGAEVICRWLFRERLQFYKIGVYSWKAYPPFSSTKEKGCFIAPCEWMKKARQFDFTPTIASDFCSSSNHNCCTTGMTRTTTSVSTAQRIIFLLGLLAAYVAQANILVSASSCKQGASEDISQAGHTKTQLLLP